MILVSVIVPVYNSEQYLDQCVRSLINQTLKEVEFIFVDDGSTDSSVQILEKYQQSDKRIKIIKQKNQYAGVARNNGLAQATGKYVIFLDSDDFFKLNMLEKMYSAAEKYQAEITIAGYYKYNEINNIQRKNMIVGNHSSHSVFQSGELEDAIFTTFNLEVWNKLYLKSYIDTYGIHFQDIKNCNDLQFSCISIYHAKKIKVLYDCFVYYRKNNSQSLQGNLKKCAVDTCIVNALTSLKKELLSLNAFDGKIKESFYNLACSHIEYHVDNFSSSIGKMKAFYSSLKKSLIPLVFDDKSDVPINSAAYNIDNSESFEEFLLLELSRYKSKIKGMVPCTSKSFILGKTILTVPKGIISFFRRIIYS